MDQPALGLKVAQLRQQRGLTQERLAKLCEVRPRTIPWIESGQLDPRADTLERLGTALDFDFGRERSEEGQLSMAVLHLSSALPTLIVPLLIWASQKSRSRRIDRQGRQVLNFQITMALILFAFGMCMIAGLVAPVLLPGWAKENEELYAQLAGWLPLVSASPMILIGIYCTFEGVINTIRALSERPIHYAPSIRFVK